MRFHRWSAALGRILAISSLAGSALFCPALTLRAPSVPLVACDPYFSIWSPADKLTDADTVHWTGKPHRLTSLARIDGVAHRLLGKYPSQFTALPQVATEVWPTRTVCLFEGAGVRLALEFMTPALPDDLMIYTRPVTYITWTAESTDGRPHAVQVYFDAAPEVAVNEPTQAVKYEAPAIKGLQALRVGSVEQPLLQKKGDDLRIDWGWFYAAAPVTKRSAWQGGALDRRASRDRFARRGADLEEQHLPDAGLAAQEAPVLAFAADLGQVKSDPVSRWLALAYDDEFSIQYFGTNLRPYWRRHGDDAVALLKKSAAEYEKLRKRGDKFDRDLVASLIRAGGEKYARICALAYRQCVAANKVVADANGQPLMFPKENFSNGCIGTVDVIYPMAPQFLLFSPALTRAMLVPILDYAASPRWKWPFAPHDLGTYPHANGQVYGGGERTEENQMPVEETANLLILLAALAHSEGNADFCARHWPVLERWTDYLKAKGLDPENQLCTDDFAGHLAHNVNLSAKAICGLGAFGRLCEMRGQTARAADIKSVAQGFSQQWAHLADDGDHFRLAFDKPGTWSQKYNLVWDRILGLGLFNDSVKRMELSFYRRKLGAFGLPLDNRKGYAKTDWTLWTATLTQDRQDFEALVDPVWRFLNETPVRVPMTDWYWTQDAKMAGFQARPVVGGLFLQMLYDGPVWRQYASADRRKVSGWAPLPVLRSAPAPAP